MYLAIPCKFCGRDIVFSLLVEIPERVCPYCLKIMRSNAVEITGEVE